MKALATEDLIESKIFLIRGQKVMLDADLAFLYGTTSKALNQAVKRNRSRFPEDFIFQLSAKEKNEVVTNCDHLTKLKFSPTLPYAFTEHGAVMVASILNTKRAVEVSIYVVRAFVKFRGLLASHRALAGKLAELEQRVGAHDETLQALVEAIKELMMPPEKPKRKIGFIAKERQTAYKASQPCR